MENPEQHTCVTCGYTWKHGEHGGHQCTKLLLERIECLEDEVDSLCKMLDYIWGLDNPGAVGF